MITVKRTSPVKTWKQRLLPLVVIILMVGLCATVVYAATNFTFTSNFNVLLGEEEVEVWQGTTQMSLGTNTIDWGDVDRGSSYTREFTVVNSGGVPVEVTITTPNTVELGYQVSSNRSAFSIPVGGSPEAVTITLLVGANCSSGTKSQSNSFSISAVAAP